MTLPEDLLADGLDDLKTSVRFLTRLPLPRATQTGGSLARAAWAFPLAGILVGTMGAAVYALAHRLGLPAWPAAALSVAATLAVTGALHEDGLADTADGFGGGATHERKLEIMRDSRIGTYGVCALTLSLLLRVSALASLGNATSVVLALIAAHGAARATLPAFMSLLPAARSDGLSRNAGQPKRESVIIAAVLGVAILLLCLGPVAAITAACLLAVVVALIAWLSSAQIGGQTGDVIGALEQTAEIVILLVALR